MSQDKVMEISIDGTRLNGSDTLVMIQMSLSMTLLTTISPGLLLIKTKLKLPRAIAAAVSAASIGAARIPMGYQIPNDDIINGNVINCAPSPAPNTEAAFIGIYLDNNRE